jgi:hypothetical protein
VRSIATKGCSEQPLQPYGFALAIVTKSGRRFAIYDDHRTSKTHEHDGCKYFPDVESKINQVLPRKRVRNRLLSQRVHHPGKPHQSSHIIYYQSEKVHKTHFEFPAKCLDSKKVLIEIINFKHQVI